MRFGKVIGHVVLSTRCSSLEGGRWLVVSPMMKEQIAAPDGQDLSDEPSAVVYDELGGRVGDVIGFTEGGEATWPFDKPKPVDAYNALIVDRVNI